MGPLTGIRVIEVAGIGPGPFCAMMLADMGAEVVRVDRVTDVGGSRSNVSSDLLRRGRKSLAVDLKDLDGVELVLRMCESADVLQEGFRPGVMERLGLGPDECLQRNPKLIYGRMTGWGQTGPLSHAAGHDINYISLSGALHGIGTAGGPPVPPLNLVGDYGGGGMLLAFGICAALVERAGSGKGQVVDAAMTDGSSLLMTSFHGRRAAGVYSAERGTNLQDSGAHFYNTYETADGKYISVGSIEPQFYATLLRLLNFDPSDEQYRQERWPEMREQLARIFASKSRDEWCRLLDGSDACFAPVLDIEEAYLHRHNIVRGAFIEIDGLRQPAPAPRFSRTSPQCVKSPSRPGQDTKEVLSAWGFEAGEVAALVASGAIAQE